MPRGAWSGSAGVRSISDMYYVYILKSLKKDWYYVGSTENLDKRLKEHNAGSTPSTRPHAPFQIVHLETYDNITESRKREALIKKNHALKKSLIPGLK